MSISAQIARQLREVYSGGNLTGSCLQDNLEGITWQQATTSVQSLNSIAALTFHINYYTSGLIAVLQGGELTIRDKYSYNLPPINNNQDWDQLCKKALTDGETFAQLIEQLPDAKLWETFVLEKYGNYYRNISGMIEHTHYHLGQIAVIRKMILQVDK